MTCYMIGPEDVTMGREFFVRQEGVDGEGKLHLFAGKLWYVGPSLRFAAEPTKIVGVDNAAKTTTVGMARGSLSAASNNAFGFQADLATSAQHAALTPGAEVIFETIVNGQAAKLGTFNLDTVGPTRSGTGSGLSAGASSAALKKLAQWESDASYDYLSQAKSDCLPANLASLIRVGGRWAASGDWLYPDYFNEDGYLYTSEVPNRSGISVGRFKRMSNEYDPQFGLGMNYYRENAYDASQRLGRDAEESEYGSNGVFALYGSTEHNSGHGFGVYIVEDSEWHKQTSFAYDLPLDTETWFLLKCIDGLVELYARTTTAWWLVGSHQIEDYAHLPWKRDELGRGAAFLRNSTPHSPSYQFGSEDDYIPVDDNSVFPASETVIVDEEVIDYTEKSINESISGLQFQYGFLCSSYETVGPNLITFADDRIRSRIIQQCSVPDTTYRPTAVRVWVQKMNYPEDGLYVGVYATPKDATAPLGTMYAEGVIDPEDVPVEGGWVTVPMSVSNALPSTSCWIIVTRGKDAHHPIATTYYKTKTGGGDYASKNTYYFNETTDAWIAITDALPFDLFATNHLAGEKYPLHVKPFAGLSAVVDYYKGLAFVVTEGKGAGETFLITGSTASDPIYGARFSVDRNPINICDETSVLKVVPTLSGLTRAKQSTLAASHGASICHIWRARPLVMMNAYRYFSGNVDLSLRDVAYKIARKAGVLETVAGSLYPTSVTPSVYSGDVEARNFVMRIKLSDIGSDTVVLSSGRTAPGAPGLDLTISGTEIAYAKAGVTQETFPLAKPMIGWVTVSFYENYISVWCEGKFIHSFVVETWDGTFFAITGTYASPIEVDMPEACIRTDNFILDAGKRGAMLLSELIGARRFFYQDDKDGCLRIFRGRTEVNTEQTPYTLEVENTQAESDGSIVTRLRVEGAEVEEHYDYEMMRLLGNLFHVMNINEVNSVYDARYFNDMYLEDFGSRRSNVTITGALDPESGAERHDLQQLGRHRAEADRRSGERQFRRGRQPGRSGHEH